MYSALIDVVNEINQGIFPCIWINITYKPDVLSESDLMATEKELLLERVWDKIFKLSYKKVGASLYLGDNQIFKISKLCKQSLAS